MSHDRLVAARAHFAEGGPEVIVFGYFDKGNVPVYSWAALAISVIGFAVHLPFLDRAERRRREIAHPPDDEHRTPDARAIGEPVRAARLTPKSISGVARSTT